VSESINDSSVKTKKHSHLRTIFLPELSRLDAAAPSEHALAACVVRPSRSWIHMVQSHVTKFVLCAGVAHHTPLWLVDLQNKRQLARDPRS
jgi:hypothetical protein